MSLINKMLRDLDARRAPAADRPILPNAVHLAHRRAGRDWLPMLLACGGGALLAGVAWYWFAGRSASAPVVPPQIQASAPVPAPVAEARLAPPTPPPVSAAAPALPAAPAMPEPVAMTPPPTVAPQLPAAAGVPAVSKPLAPPAKPVPVATAAKPAAPVSAKMAGAQTAAVPAVQGSIEKQPSVPLAESAAENEYNKGIEALRRGANAESMAFFQSALRLNARHVAARQALLSLLVRQQQWGQAAALAEEGLALLPAQTPWAVVLARLQADAGKLAEATDTLARHAPHAERNADYQALYAVLLQKQKRFHEAVDRYLAAVTLRSTEGRWWYGLGVSLEGDQRPQEAREAFLKARDAGNLPPELAGSLKSHLQ